MNNDKDIENWIKRKTDWLDLKTRYFTRNIEDAKELKSDVLESLWNYRHTFSGEATDERIENYVFHIIKYRYFHILEQKYKKPTYEIPEFMEKQLSTEATILNDIYAKEELEGQNKAILDTLGQNRGNILIDRLNGLNLTQIAEKHKLEYSTVAGYLNKAKKTMTGKTIIVNRSKPKEFEIQAINEDGQVMHKFSNQTEAWLSMGESYRNGISRAIKDPKYKCAGYFWKKTKINGN